MKKIFVFVLLLLLLVWCSQRDVQQNTDLEESIYSVVGDKNKSEISIKTLTSFDWDKALLFTPYSTQENIEEQLGADFKDPSNIDIRDDIYLLVFLNKDKVVQYVEIARQGADFSMGEKGYLTPSEDVIRIKRH
ncbi:hypothetical protein SAMN04487943_10535 [Gracilibacillus orientalis]|uniref:Lipoprotein n=1 Tax=Gracilibacillus orientalis TaxID=334253 RepID=A0A1I4LIB2_9BACI|nr:hypothetical protein [Gracilibacillus orientalis]SFL90669.1 hypothetical protein SAMN04487943_10535 [Gracilibacillus orientalis]